MIYYKCYDAHADRNVRWAETDQRWRVLMSKHKWKVARTEEECDAIHLHSDGRHIRDFQHLYSRLKPLKKSELPEPCVKVLDELFKNYETTEVT
jgi:hypothetical protein